MAPGRKAKAKGDELDVSEARHGVEFLDRNEQLPREMLEKVFQLAQPSCPPTCGQKGNKGNKDNPECFHHLLPAKDSYRKKGLWQKEPSLGQLQSDPADMTRGGPEVPAGLKNLGNTCYVNAVVQFLHAIPEFRHALYVLEPEIAAVQEDVRELRDLFIDMHFGPYRYVDPKQFADSLKLDYGVQQDGQEFLKLLLQKLEEVFAASKQAEVRGVVQRLFRGYSSNVITCRSCNQQSESSRRQHGYYELELSVEHMQSLQQSLVTALSAEELVGDNQYHCDFCGMKCDAQKQMRLRSLPPYLCLSLQRFVFDAQTYEKKKATNKLSIPLVLDLSPVLICAGLDQPETAPAGPDGSTLLPGHPGAVYELAAVLIHKGTSASHGHYVAHIRTPDTRTWWRFDDETAEEMGPTPTNFPADHGTTAQTQAAAAAVDKDTIAADSDDTAAGTAGSRKRGRGGGAASSSKRGRGAAGAVKRGTGARKTRDEEDSDYEGDKSSRSKANKTRGRGKGSSRAGRGRKAAAAADEYDEEAMMRAVQDQSLQEHIAQQQEIMASLGMQQDLQDGTAMDCDDEQAAAAAAAALEQRQACKRGRVAAAPLNGTEASAAKRKAGRGKASNTAEGGEAAQKSGEEAVKQQQGQAAEEQIEIVSGNAYFLVYRQRNSPIGRGKTAEPTTAGTAAASTPSHSGTADTAGGGDPAAAEANGAADAAHAVPAAAQGNINQHVQLHAHLLQQLASLPEAVQERVQLLHDQFAQECATFEQMKTDALERIKERQEEVSGIHQLLPVTDPLDEGYFIPSAWLDSWANSEDGPGPIDNSVLLCNHQPAKLCPERPASSYKRISSTAWEALQANHKGGPALALSDACPTCLRNLLQGLVGSDRLAMLRESLLTSLSEDDEINAAAGQLLNSGYYVSRTWVTGFRLRQRLSGGSLLPPTAGITCRHNQLAPEALANTAKRFRVSDRSWQLLKEVWAMQVVREVGLKRAKAAKAAAQRVAAGQIDDDDVKIVEIPDADGDVKIVDAVQSVAQPPTAEGSSGDQQQQNGVKTEAELTDSDAEQLEQQQPGDVHASSPSAAALAAWQFPILLDGSVEVTEEQLLTQECLPEFPVMQCYDCAECQVILQEALADHQGLKQQLELQKQTLSKLLAGSVTENLEPGVPYYLVPNDWIKSWRAHIIAASSKRLPGKAVQPPPPLPDAIRPLLCTCHPDSPGVAVPMPLVINKRGRFAQADPQTEALRIVTEQDWQQLLLHHSGLTVQGDQQQQLQQHEQQPVTSEVAVSRKPPGRPRRGSAAAHLQREQQQQQAQQQEQQEMVLQQIASMADVDPGFKGIRAWLKTAPVDSTEAHQHQQPLQQVQHHCVHQQQHEQPMVNAVCEHQVQGQPLQQLQSPGQLQQAVDLQQQEAMETSDVECVSPAKQQQLQPSQQVDLTSSPKKQRASAVADAAGQQLLNDVKIVADPSATAIQQLAKAGDAVQLVKEVATTPAKPPVASAAAALTAMCRSPRTAAAVRQAVEEPYSDAALSSESDPVGLHAAATNSDDWQPDASADDAVSKEQQQRSSRTTRRQRPHKWVATANGDAADSGADGTAQAAALRGWLETDPAPCAKQLAAMAEAQRAAMLVYDSAEVMVELITEDELPTAFVHAAVERKSKRARKNRLPLKVSSSDSLAQLRLKVFEGLAVHPKNQRIYARGTLLEGEQNTLAQLEVFPDEELRVINTNEVPNDDYASVFDGVSTGKKRREIETGFKNTALVASGTGPQTAEGGQSAHTATEAEVGGRLAGTNG